MFAGISVADSKARTYVQKRADGPHAMLVPIRMMRLSADGYHGSATCFNDSRSSLA